MVRGGAKAIYVSIKIRRPLLPPAPSKAELTTSRSRWQSAVDLRRDSTSGLAHLARRPATPPRDDSESTRSDECCLASVLRTAIVAMQGTSGGMRQRWAQSALAFYASVALRCVADSTVNAGRGRASSESSPQARHVATTSH